MRLDERPTAVLQSLLARLFLAMALLAGLGAAASAQSTPPRQVTVAVNLTAPFVMKAGSGYTGLAVDLWEEIANRGGLTTRFVEYPTPTASLAAVVAGEADIAVGNLTITRERELSVDFTQPWQDTGLRVMTDGATGTSFFTVVADLWESGHAWGFIWLAIAIIVATLLLTLFDRRFDAEFPRGWFAGIVESFYHVMSVTTSGQTSRKTMFGPFGRLFAALWLVAGVAFIAFVTSSITSVMTAAAITDRIQSVDDLRGHTVGVLAGGASEVYAREAHLPVRPFDDIEAADAALRRGEVDAVIGDAHILQYHVHHVAAAGLDIVGPVFDEETYGFAMPSGSLLTSSVTLDLLGTYEDGTIEALRNKYFGEFD